MNLQVRLPGPANFAPYNVAKNHQNKKKLKENRKTDGINYKEMFCVSSYLCV